MATINIQINSLDEALHLQNLAAINIGKYQINPVQGQEQLQNNFVHLWREIRTQASEAYSELLNHPIQQAGVGELEQHLFSGSIHQITERFSRGDADQQYALLGELDAIAKKLTPVTVHRPQVEVLADLKHAITEGGDRAQIFFSHSFVSWYRNGNDSAKPMLHHWVQLDMSNRLLFLEMLALRDTGHFDDEGLFQFEQFCLGVIGE